MRALRAGSLNEATGQGISGGATTRWNYDTYQGWLKSKDYPDASTGSPPAQEGTGGPVYTNKVSGRLATRVWKRGVATGYTYNSAGELATIDCSYTTPDVVYTYDRRGRRVKVEQGPVGSKITTDLRYNDADQALTEAYTGGTLAGLNMAWTYDSALRRDTVRAKNGGTTQQAATYQYDTAGRLWKLSDSSYVATYGYHANSMLISSLGYTNGVGTGQGLAVSRAYDRLKRLTSVSSKPYGSAAASLPLSFGYQYNTANQRTRADLGDGTYWVYEYDALGQVTGGRRYWGDGTPVAGQDFTYAFDEIGNRQTTGGRASSVSSYTNNRLNQITGRSVPPYVDVLGVANPTANVTVRVVGSTTYTSARKGEYFHHALNVPNSTAQYPSIEVKSLYGATQAETNKVFVAAATESPAHDADGNLTQDGRWTYTWDGENRLVQMIRDTASPSGARQKLVFEYDHQGRRIRKTFSTYSGGWQEQSDLIFLYDGWNLVGEFDANASNAKVRTYVWGTDLSGTTTGAGGVGGLLWLNNHQSTFEGKTLPTGVQYAAYDGNGNVAALVKATDGSVTARYDYGPFGETVRQSGVLADAQPFRFSTKWTDAESGLVCYGYRYYKPSTGRWLNRDPIGEHDGPNVYAYVHNNPINQIDPFGLWSSGVHHKIIDDWLADPIWDKYYWRCCERIPVRRLLKDGSDEVDGVGDHTAGFFDAQSTKNAYKHAMSMPGEPLFSAEARYKQFIEFNLNEARRLSDRARSLPCASAPANLVYEAVRRVGMAFHSISDNLSPAHTGFQLWDGSWNPTDIMIHASKENMAAYTPMSPQVVGAVDAELMSYLLYVLGI